MNLTSTIPTTNEQAFRPQLIWAIPNVKIVITQSQEVVLADLEEWNEYLGGKSTYLTVNSALYSEEIQGENLRRLRGLGFSTSPIGRIPIHIGH
jgi:hypothetical protein